MWRVADDNKESGAILNKLSLVNQVFLLWARNERTVMKILPKTAQCSIHKRDQSTRASVWKYSTSAATVTPQKWQKCGGPCALLFGYVIKWSRGGGWACRGGVSSRYPGGPKGNKERETAKSLLIKFSYQGKSITVYSTRPRVHTTKKKERSTVLWGCYFLFKVLYSDAVALSVCGHLVRVLELARFISWQPLWLAHVRKGDHQKRCLSRICRSELIPWHIPLPRSPEVHAQTKYSSVWQTETKSRFHFRAFTALICIRPC